MRSKQREFWWNLATSSGMGIGLTMGVLAYYGTLDTAALVDIASAFAKSFAITLGLSAIS